MVIYMGRYEIKNYSMYKWWVNIYYNENFQGKQYKCVINCFNSMFQDFLIKNPKWLKTLKNKKYNFPLNWTIFNGGFIFFADNFVNMELIYDCINEIEISIFRTLYVDNWIKKYSEENSILKNQIIIEYNSDKFLKMIFVNCLNQVNKELLI